VCASSQTPLSVPPWCPSEFASHSNPSSALLKMAALSRTASSTDHAAPDPALSIPYRAVVTRDGVTLLCDCGRKWHMTGDASSVPPSAPSPADLRADLLQHAIDQCPLQCRRCCHLLEPEMLDAIERHVLVFACLPRISPANLSVINPLFIATAHLQQAIEACIRCDQRPESDTIQCGGHVQLISQRNALQWILTEDPAERIPKDASLGIFSYLCALHPLIHVFFPKRGANGIGRPVFQTCGCACRSDMWIDCGFAGGRSARWHLASCCCGLCEALRCCGPCRNFCRCSF
jgi:hypothetical protein